MKLEPRRFKQSKRESLKAQRRKTREEALKPKKRKTEALPAISRATSRPPARGRIFEDDDTALQAKGARQAF